MVFPKKGYLSSRVTEQLRKFFQREGVDAGTKLRVATVGAFRDSVHAGDGLRVLLHHGAQIYGFDSPKNCDITKAEFSVTRRIPCGGSFQCIGGLVGDGKKHRFFYNEKFPWISSLYKVKRRLWQHFINDISDFRAVNVSTSRLDDLNLGRIDFLKMDIQGAELSALSGSEKTLQSVLVVQVEVSGLLVGNGSLDLNFLIEIKGCSTKPPKANNFLQGGQQQPRFVWRRCTRVSRSSIRSTLSFGSEASPFIGCST